MKHDAANRRASVSAMVVMSRAIRGAIEPYAPTLSELPKGVLLAFAELIAAFAADLQDEVKRRG